MEDKLTPNLRFAGFTDAWEQRELSTLSDMIETGKSKFIKNSSGEYEILGSTSVIGYDNSYDYEGDFILTARVGANAGELYRHSGKVKISDNTVFIKGRDLNFLFYSLCHFDIKKLSFGTGQPLVKASELKELKLSSPSNSAEKKEIGNMFASLDSLLTLHQRKYEQLKSIKKTLLQKMFPKYGENVPEIRFAGFTDAWEQRKLGDIFEEYSEKQHEELPPLMVVQGGGTIKREESDRALQYDKSNLSNYKLARKDDFILHLRSFEGGLEIVNCDGIVSPAYHIFHGEAINPLFYYTFFRSKEFIEVLLKPHVYGIRDGKSIDVEGMKTIQIPYTSLEEQNKIGGLLGELDSLLTLHQRKCEELKNIKKALLQNMFV